MPLMGKAVTGMNRKAIGYIGKRDIECLKIRHNVGEEWGREDKE